MRVAVESERPIAHVAHDFGMHPETLRKKMRQRPVLRVDSPGARNDAASWIASASRDERISVETA